MTRSLPTLSTPQPRLPSSGSWQSRLATALGLDVMDFLLRGALGLRFGFPVGALVGLKLAHTLGWRDRRAWKLAALCGVYCMIPGSELLPIGTASTALALLVGALDRGPGGSTRVDPYDITSPEGAPAAPGQSWP